ncbi:16S rRNA (uracil(1498)-N(3))-methyltransferase [Deferribacterales bacterium Es71-Z0220]|uniref:RsmE family RNA methyltransferase n=1 Tax=Deferrivibrio essentukiensis TaxID=2880922 RepID=UPI001F61F972|nr:RsmE family RNA methyltransferase [Deferrivibrio essentukiensis]MCB4204107.1 16S rRNA (uracil(1498)-N(3))-methyltransferase [Deferrivibrio essentukiensis]
MEGIKRFYWDNKFDERIEIKGEILNHIKVLRLKVQDRIVLQNEFNIGLYEIESLNKKNTLLKRISIKNSTRPNYRLIACISLMKREYMDNSIEKLAEIGVTEIIPIITERSLRQLNSETMLRYQKKAIFGSLQAENNFITKVMPARELKDLIFNDCEKILFYERADKQFPNVSSTDVVFFIGPEGGLSMDEVNYLNKIGFKICSPFKSVLKGETAAVVFAGLLRSEIEKLSL